MANKSSKRKLWNLGFILLTLIVLYFIVFFDKDIDDIGAAFAGLDSFWIGIGFLFLLGVWLTDAVIQYYAMRHIYGKHSFWHCLKVAIIGQYYSALTPFASGGQPMQIVYMNREGIPVGTATSILTIKFFAYQISLTALFIIALFIGGSYIDGRMLPFTIVGFLINAGAIFLMLLVMINQPMVERLLHWLLRVGIRMRLIRNPDRANHKIDTVLHEFNHGIQYMRHNMLHFFVLCLITVVQILFYMGIVYMVYRACGLRQVNAIDLISVHIFHYMTVSFVPLPGAAVASEGGFILFFSQFFTGASVASVAMLIWRVLTYYMNIVAGAFVVLFDSIMGMFSVKRKDRIQKRAVPKTFSK